MSDSETARIFSSAVLLMIVVIIGACFNCQSESTFALGICGGAVAFILTND